jgi:hypothetical protein
MVAAPPTAVIVMGLLIVVVSVEEPGFMATVPAEETAATPLARVS